MRIGTTIFLLAPVPLITAISVTAFTNSALIAMRRAASEVSEASTSLFVTKRDNCPAIWSTISKDLHDRFLTGSQCNDLARAAIREAFHDCGSWDKTQGTTGGCDGSLILAPGELQRGENKGLEEISALLLDLKQNTYPSVSVADLIQFAGAVAIVTCPGGPIMKIAVGRKDSSAVPPNGNLPAGAGAGSDATTLFNLFKNKGFTENELAALLGAHTCSKQFNLNTTMSGYAQDDTPGVWDVNYYAQTVAANPSAGVFVIPGDRNLATDASTGVAKEFRGFVGNQGKWTSAFAAAMTKMSLLGVPNPGKLIDCTNSLPKGTSIKRDIRAAPINARFH